MGLRAKITDAVYDHPRADDQINAVMGAVEAEVAHWRTEAADAKRVMDRRGKYVKELKAKLATARELHQPYKVTDNPMELCRTCDTIYPCATKLALDGGQ